MSGPPATECSDTGGEFFRCPVPPDQANAQIKVGLRRVMASVQEASIDGFTILVQRRHSRQLKVGKPWLLEYKGARFEVQPQWFFQSPEGHIQMGLRRLEDLTELKPVGSWRSLLGGRQSFEEHGTSTLAYAGLILVIFLTLALPGVGEELGTSQHISRACESIIQAVDRCVERWW